MGSSEEDVTQPDTPETSETQESDPSPVENTGNEPTATPTGTTTEQNAAPGAPKQGDKKPEPQPDLSQAQPTAKPPEGQKPKPEAKDKKKNVQKPQQPKPQEPGKKPKKDAGVSDVYVRNIMAIMDIGKDIGENLKAGFKQRRELKKQQTEAAKKQNAANLVKNVNKLADSSKRLQTATDSLKAKDPKELAKSGMKDLAKYRDDIKNTQAALAQQRALNDKARAAVDNNQNLSPEQRKQAVQRLDEHQASLGEAGKDLARMEQGLDQYANRLAAYDAGRDAAPEATVDREQQEAQQEGTLQPAVSIYEQQEQQELAEQEEAMQAAANMFDEAEQEAEQEEAMQAAANMFDEAEQEVEQDEAMQAAANMFDEAEQEAEQDEAIQAAGEMFNELDEEYGPQFEEDGPQVEEDGPEPVVSMTSPEGTENGDPDPVAFEAYEEDVTAKKEGGAPEPKPQVSEELDSEGPSATA